MVVLDQETRTQIPGAANLFLQPPYPMSANFSGRLPREREQAVHINPAQAVKLAQDKARLYKHLDAKGNPLGNYVPMGDFVKNGAFQLGKFEDTFPDMETAPVDIIGELGQLSLEELEEFLAYLQKVDEKDVAVRSKIQSPETGYVRAIPNAAGKRLNVGARDVNDGILAHNIPTKRVTDNGKALLNGAVKALEDVDLDYGTVHIRFSPDGDFEVLDVLTGLSREDAIAIRSYADMLNKAKNVVKRKG